MPRGRSYLRLLVALTGLVLLAAGGDGLRQAIAERRPTESFLTDIASKPEAMVAAALVALGLACLVLLPLVGRSRPEPLEGNAPSTGPAPIGAPRRAVELRISGLLLNLPREAGAGQIEQAPPLGPRDQVVSALAGALPGIAFDADGRGVFTRPGYSVHVACEPGDPVVTAVIRAQGDGGALVALRHLTAKTGWRLFLPRRNAFLDAVRDDELIESDAGAQPRGAPPPARAPQNPGVRLN